MVIDPLAIDALPRPIVAVRLRLRQLLLEQVALLHRVQRRLIAALGGVGHALAGEVTGIQRALQPVAPAIGGIGHGAAGAQHLNGHIVLALGLAVGLCQLLGREEIAALQAIQHRGLLRQAAGRQLLPAGAVYSPAT